jgi:molybdopterin-guanine dinucleotide biosynthesis protein A
VPAALLARLADGGAVRAGGRIEPFPARYEPEWLPELRAALEREAPVRATLEALDPATIEWDPEDLRSINTPEDL